MNKTKEIIVVNETKHWDSPDYFTWTSISLNYPEQNSSDKSAEAKSTIASDIGDYDNYFIGGSSGEDVFGDVSGEGIGSRYFTDNSTNSTAADGGGGVGLPQVVNLSSLNTSSSSAVGFDGEIESGGSASGNLSTIYGQITDRLLVHNGTNGTGGGNGSIADDNDPARMSVEAGSNFVLLFEDFGEYFYNYNGSGFNESSISTLPYNCSIANASCPEVAFRKYHLN